MIKHDMHKTAYLRTRLKILKPNSYKMFLFMKLVLNKSCINFPFTVMNLKFKLSEVTVIMTYTRVKLRYFLGYFPSSYLVTKVDYKN